MSDKLSHGQAENNHREMQKRQNTNRKYRERNINANRTHREREKDQPVDYE